MKHCSKCGKFKPETEFFNDKRQKSGLTCWCKACLNEKHKQYYKRVLAKRKPKPEKANKKNSYPVNNYTKPVYDERYLGGWNISILNYAKPGEFKFTIASTRGSVYQFNSNEKFLNKIKELIGG